jgi:hypothetical protein
MVIRRMRTEFTCSASTADLSRRPVIEAPDRSAMVRPTIARFPANATPLGPSGQTVGVDDFASANAALGQLEVLDLDALRLMYRVERAGQEFYERIAAGIGNDEAAGLLRANGTEELKHAERIGRMIAIKQGHDFEPTDAELAPLAVHLPDPVPVELLPHIVAGEVAGDAGYQRWADNEPDPEVQRLLRLNGREETIHSERVTAVLALLSP